eukprot:g44308.t1
MLKCCGILRSRKKWVLGLLKSIKVDKTLGPGGIYSRLLSEAREEIVGALTKIFASSLATREVLEDWSAAPVVPLFKEGDGDNSGNYRPSAWLCAGQVKSYLTEFFEKLTRVIDQGREVDIVYMDFSKAFNKIPHGMFVQKIKIYEPLADSTLFCHASLVPTENKATCHIRQHEQQRSDRQSVMRGSQDYEFCIITAQGLGHIQSCRPYAISLRITGQGAAQRSVRDLVIHLLRLSFQMDQNEDGAIIIPGDLFKKVTLVAIITVTLVLQRCREMEDKHDSKPRSSSNLQKLSNSLYIKKLQLKKMFAFHHGKYCEAVNPSEGILNKETQ